MTDTFDSSDPKAVKAAIKDAKSKDLIAIEGLKAMMQTEPGRVWLNKLVNVCSPFTNPFSSDPAVMAFRCGEVNIGLQVIADLNEASSDLYLLMIKENAK
jgi:hypothetical protein